MNKLQRWTIYFFARPSILSISSPVPSNNKRFLRDVENCVSRSTQAALLAPLDEEAGRVGGPDERKPAGGGVPDFPPPAGREILLRTCVPRPAPYSKALPQRLFCVLMREDFRLAGAFSSDTSFF
ncbi:rab3 GTPase-activating protein catalytic subunit isoform X1 [Tachysurus ichikawai]